MKIILSPRRHHYVAIVSIFLIILIMGALIAGMAGCTPATRYDLTIASTAGGAVTEPGEDTFTYREGKVVDLVAEADEGYRFVNWTGDVGSIDNVDAATTTIIMNDDYSITANFVRQYNLTISSTYGGSVTTPGTGTYTYDAGTVVNLVATPDAGYQFVFVNWTGDVGTIGNVSVATTTITMNGDYTVTANFVPPPPPNPVSISNIVVTPTKIGNAAVITWVTDVPTTNNIVVYDQSWPPSTPSSPGLDNVYEHVVVISGLIPNSTYYYRVRGLEYVSDVYTFVAQNAKNAWDGSRYTVNMLITLTWDVPGTSDPFLTTWFTNTDTDSYMAQAAQDIYDATDGYIRLGTAIVVDNQQKGNALWQTSDMTFEDTDDPATTDLDERYQSTGGSAPYYYYNDDWLHTPAIENASGGVGMQFGSIGSIRNQDWSWNSTTQNDTQYQSGWQARIITHEFGHYALYLPDRYVYNVTTNRTDGWDTNNTSDSDLMSVLGYYYWENSTLLFRYYTEFGAGNSYQTGYSDPFGEGNTYNQPPLPVNYSSWYIIINRDPVANSTIPHYRNAYDGVEPAYPDAGPTTGNGDAFNVIFINN